MITKNFPNEIFSPQNTIKYSEILVIPSQVAKDVLTVIGEVQEEKNGSYNLEIQQKNLNFINEKGTLFSDYLGYRIRDRVSMEIFQGLIAPIFDKKIHMELAKIRDDMKGIDAKIRLGDGPIKHIDFTCNEKKYEEKKLLAKKSLKFKRKKGEKNRKSYFIVYIPHLITESIVKQLQLRPNTSIKKITKSVLKQKHFQDIEIKISHPIYFYEYENEEIIIKAGKEIDEKTQNILDNLFYPQ